MLNGPLDGYVVIDLSSGIAGAYGTKLLADAGADVVLLEDPDGHPLRSWSASGAQLAAGHDGPLFSFLSCSKQSVAAQAADDADLRAVAGLLDAADAVVWSAGSKLANHPSLSPQAIRQAHPHLTVTAISPFGLHGPWSGRPATEFTLQAWSGGIIGLGRGAPGTPPVSVGGRPGEWLGGVHAAIATLVSRLRGTAAGSGKVGTAAGGGKVGTAGGGKAGTVGELIDISMLEALALALTYYPVTFFDIAGRPYRSQRSVPTPGVESARDGFVGLGTGTGQQWLDFCVMVGHPEWGENQALRFDKTPIADTIHGWMADRSVAEILDLAAAFRIPSAPIGNGASLPKEPHFVERGSFVPNPRDGFVQPAPPFRFTPALLRAPTPAPRLGQHNARLDNPGPARTGEPAGAPPALPLAGLRVLDMTAFWAGPVCTHVLALLGADVIHVESPSRPDGTRLLAGLPFTDDRWWERSGIFAGLNTNKQSLTLDLGDERGRQALRELLATCDVIVENYTPRVLEQLGLTFEAVKSLRPDIVMVRMPGFGLSGPWRDNPAFAFVIEDAAGLSWLTGPAEGNPLSPYCLGDPAAGLHALAALLIALEHRKSTGQGVLVEAAMVEAAINMASEQIVEFSAFGALLSRDGNHGPAASPQDVYRASDDAGGDTTEGSWVAISVATEAQWAALRELLGLQASRSDRERVDQQVAAWCAQRCADEIVEQLWNAGVPVGKVLQPHQQGELEQLQSRGFFEELDHPVNGPARYSTFPSRFSAGPERFHTRHAPLFGEHSREVLASLGMGDADLDALEADRVTATAPPAAS